MPNRGQLLADVTVHGPRTHLRGVQAAGVEYRAWIAPFPTCPALNPYGIVHVGLMEARTPYRIVRTKQTSTYFLACSAGRGRVLIDGRWRDCGAGMACLLPAHALNAMQAIPGVRWEFGWVCYVLPNGEKPVASPAAPVLARYEAGALRCAITGLLEECLTGAVPATCQHWVDLIQEYVLRFAQPTHQDQRLLRLWERVKDRLDEPWTLPRLATQSGYSKEHLRRLCHHEIGRSPMHHVVYLRMRRAAELLTQRADTIEAIARQVGYQNPFVFSNAFQRWVGWRPSEYRRGIARKNGGSASAPTRPGVDPR